MKKIQLLLILLLFGSGALWAQTQVFTGIVRDSATNTPLADVSVKVKDKNIAATTGSDGAFSINVPSGSTALEVSFVGYGTQTVNLDLNNPTGLIIYLGHGNQAVLGEVVVTALGISKESRRIGYAVSSVNGEQLSRAKETNVALSLAGQVAGLNVHGTSGGPGSSARILLRGMPSMNSGGSPLFVINGVPMDNSQRGAAGEWGGSDNGDGISNINPDDIETMTVLKGQAASALYGARASNGVILITTKSGKKGAATINYITNYQQDKAIDFTDFQYVYGQGQNGNKPANATEAQNTGRLSWGSKLDGSQFTQFDGKQYAYSPYENNIENFYRTGSTYTNTIAVSGGGDRGNYRVSVSNLDNNSIVRNSGLNRKTVNVNFDQKVIDRLSISFMANYIDEQQNNKPQLSDGPGNPNNGFFLANNINEDILKPGYDANGKEIVFSDDPYVTNPWFVVNKWINDIGRRRLITSLSAKYNIADWIYVMGRIGYDLQNDRYFTVTPTGTAFSYNSAGQSGQLNNLSTPQTSELNLDGLIGITHKLTDNINLDATLGGNARRNRFESVGVNGTQFVIPYLYTPSNVVSFGRSYAYSLREVHSAFYTVDLSYKNFLALNTTGRYDVYSTLPSDNRSIFTPSVSGSFLFSDVLHLKNLNFGKLRVAYAQTSGEPGSPYGTSVYYGVGNSINGIPTGNFSYNLPNLFLKPFTLNEIEVGAEVKLFSNRLGLDIAYFDRTTHNEIMNNNLSASSGYTSSVIGTGSTRNKGLEVQITGTPVKTKNFNWAITFNATDVHNKILQTDPAGNNVTLGTYRPLNANTAFVKGLPGPQIMARDYVYDTKGNRVVDESGLPLVRTDSLFPMGGVLPTFYGGIRNDFTFGGFNLSFLIDYNYGNKILSATSYYSIYRGLNKMTLDGREGGITTGVKEDGTANTVAAPAQLYYQRFASASRNNVLNGDYIKLRQVTLGYTLSQNLFKNVPVFSSVELSLVARNLWTIMKKSENIDPEAGFNPTVNYAGIEGTSLPTTRSFGINANFKFKTK